MTTQDPLQGIVAIGDVLAGKYRVERVLGVGGMGVVVAAMHLELDERVALKFLLPDALQNTETVARFAREARAAVKIKSEHVARVTDVGKLESGAPYMVMEFLQGGDLSELLRKERALPLSDVIEYVLQACEAIAEAHSLGIVHRDLKPANLFLARRADGSACVKVLDFGISKMTPNADGSSRDAAMTRTTAVMGSPLYMSPEQLASTRNADPRSDIWALGAIVYELVAGVPPFNAEALPQLCTAILHGVPASIVRPDLPPGLELAILKCLEKDPARRYQNVAELARAFAPFGSAGATVSAERIARVLGAPSPSAGQPRPAMGSMSGAEPSSTAISAGAQTNASWAQSKPPASKGAAVAIAVGTVVLVGAAITFFVTRDHGATPAAGAPTSSAVSAPIAQETATPAAVVPPPVVTASAEPAPVASVTAPIASATAKPAAQPASHPAGPAKQKSLFGDRN